MKFRLWNKRDEKDPKVELTILSFEEGDDGSGRWTVSYELKGETHTALSVVDGEIIAVIRLCGVDPATTKLQATIHPNSVDLHCPRTDGKQIEWWATGNTGGWTYLS